MAAYEPTRWLAQFHQRPRSLSLYIHIPFCVDRCPYCDFPTVRYDPTRRTAYVDWVCREIEGWGERLGRVSVHTVYLGGGTPGVLSLFQGARIMDTVRRVFAVPAHAEVTLETTPWTITASRLAHYRAWGVNRISLGIQSYNDRLLAAMERIHRRRHIARAVTLLRTEGWNWNADLLLGYPGQTTRAWRDTVEEVLRDEPPHISIYILEVHESTPLGRWVRSGAVHLPSDVWVWKAWCWAYRILKHAGYRFYEISNCARPGWESRHNWQYWTLGDYLGVGIGAHSCIGPYRWANPAGWALYGSMVRSGTWPRLIYRNRRERLRERILLGLRTRRGVATRWLEVYHGDEGCWREFLQEAIGRRWLVERNGRVRATPAGWFRLMKIYEGLGVA